MRFHSIRRGELYYTEMSCNGCRVLRKGCSDTCILRSCLQWIDSPDAQGHATVFVAKFFGRAGMISFINAVAESQRPALFQSLLYEACGRTVNPVFGAVGLLWSGNWAVCQAAVETVLKGGSLKSTTCPPSSKVIQLQSLQKSHGNPSLKRPRSVADTNISPNAEVKRLRSSDQHEEFSTAFGCKADVAHVDHSVPVFTSSNPSLVENSQVLQQDQSPPFPCGQLVAPVARRVKPHGGYGLAAMVVRENQQAPSEEQGMQQQQSHEADELDLSLKSHVMHAKTQARARMVERCDDVVAGSDAHQDVDSHVDHIASEFNEEEHVLVRVSSPCSLSMNSEGSVTSLDTAEFSISGVRATNATSTSRHEDCQLLHLL